MLPEYLVVISDVDPVASRLAERWGTGPAVGGSVDSVPLRRLSERAWSLRRPGRHVDDNDLDARFPPSLRAVRPTLVFPSIHRSEQQVASLTVHPLGNPGSTAEVGGRPGVLNPTDPRRMADALRRLAEGAPSSGIPATFEATHHGPSLGLPSFFVEIGFGTDPAPSEPALRLLADSIPALEPDPRDRVALAVGGGHYAPHFTELATRRHWSFGHLLSRHALGGLTPDGARSAWDQTPGAEGILYARAEDARLPALVGLGARLRDGDAPRREPAPTGASRPASGT